MYDVSAIRNDFPILSRKVKREASKVGLSTRVDSFSTFTSMMVDEPGWVDRVTPDCTVELEVEVNKAAAPTAAAILRSRVIKSVMPLNSRKAADN